MFRKTYESLKPFKTNSHNQQYKN